MFDEYGAADELTVSREESADAISELPQRVNVQHLGDSLAHAHSLLADAQAGPAPSGKLSVVLEVRQPRGYADVKQRKTEWRDELG